MHPWLLKNLCLSSLVLLFLQACSPTFGYTYVGSRSVDASLVQPLVRTEQALLFKTRIQVYNKRYSGLLLFKQIDAKKAHLTFVTEIGMKMFDFEIQDSSFKLVYIFEPLNQQRIIQLLTDDMKLLVLHDLLNKEAGLYQKGERQILTTKRKQSRVYYRLSPSHQVESIRQKAGLFGGKTVRYTFNDSLEATALFLKHKGLVRVKMQLKRIAGSSKMTNHDESTSH